MLGYGKSSLDLLSYPTHYPFQKLDPCWIFNRQLSHPSCWPLFLQEIEVWLYTPPHDALNKCFHWSSDEGPACVQFSWLTGDRLFAKQCVIIPIHVNDKWVLLTPPCWMFCLPWIASHWILGIVIIPPHCLQSDKNPMYVKHISITYNSCLDLLVVL